MTVFWEPPEAGVSTDRSCLTDVTAGYTACSLKCQQTLGKGMLRLSLNVLPTLSASNFFLPKKIPSLGSRLKISK